MWPLPAAAAVAPRPDGAAPCEMRRVACSWRFRRAAAVRALKESVMRCPVLGSAP